MSNKKPLAKTVPVPRECCSAKCKKVATHAYKLSDFWVSSCDEHLGTTLLINKVFDAYGEPKRKQPMRESKP